MTVFANHQLSKLGADWILEVTGKTRLRVLTHCNTGSLATSTWGTGLGIVRELHSRGAIEIVYVDETRPLLQGSRLTAWELSKDGINYLVQADGAAASTIIRGLVDFAVIGADRIAKNGDTANKIGSLGVALACKEAGIPFMVAAPSSTVDITYENGDSIEIELRSPEEVTSLNPVMIHAMGEAKWKFMTNAEALIHGDLHTGSVMVRAISGDEGPSTAIAFDSEFSFYGPVAFDIGALWANYTLAAARAFALGNVEFAHWTLSLIGKTWNAFAKTFSQLYESRVDSRVWKSEMLEDRLSEWKSDAWLFAAAKMSRRIVGLAKAADIETLEPNLREGAARGVLELSRLLVTIRNSDTSTATFESLASETLNRHKTR